MIKAFFIQYKMYFYSALAIVLFFAGWAVNGWRLNSKIERMKVDHLENVNKAQQAGYELANKSEQDLLLKLEQVKKEKDNALQSLQKLRGVGIDGRVVGVLSDYTKATGSATSITDNPNAINTTYDAEQQTGIIIENYAKFNECREQVIEWNQFYDSLLKEFNK
jgi:succinate dehydrogenase/fumarate reductase-like Fe-S protein